MSQQAIAQYCTRLGDNSLIQSYRLSEWCSKAPLLEEDLALTNFALDMTGRAELLLGLAGKLHNPTRTADEMAYRRGERQYLNDLIVELPNTDFAFSMIRQFLVSAFEVQLYTALTQSTHSELAGIAAKALKEVKYHYAHSADWVLRMGDGTPESNRRAQAALEKLWPYTHELFEMAAGDDTLVANGIAADAATLYAPWIERVETILAEATLDLPKTTHQQRGGHKGIHTEHMGHILTELQYLQRAYPDATW